MTAPTPHVSRRPALPLIWVVPLLALLIAGWLVARQFRDHGPQIAIEFANGSGLEPDKTQLEFKGVVVGTVKTVTLQPDLRGVVVQVRLTKSGAAIAHEGSLFWIVHPQVSLSGISGLETLVTGVHLRVRPGSGPPAVRFQGLDQPPPIEDRDAGRAFTLHTETLSNVNPGSAVFYRGIKVGSVETTRLSDDATEATIRIRIYTPYVNLVRTNTRFWNAGGIGVTIGLHGVEMQASSLQALFTGGIAFASPEHPSVAPPALDGTEFELYAKPEKEWLQWQPQIQIKPVDTTPESEKRGSDGAAMLSSATHP